MIPNHDKHEFAIKGLVVPLIFLCSLIPTLTLTPQQCIVDKWDKDTCMQKASHTNLSLTTILCWAKPTEADAQW